MKAAELVSCSWHHKLGEEKTSCSNGIDITRARLFPEALLERSD